MESGIATNLSIICLIFINLLQIFISTSYQISPLKMVLDRNDKRDFKDVVKVMMIGEVKAHSLPQDSIDINVRQVCLV